MRLLKHVFHRSVRHVARLVALLAASVLAAQAQVVFSPPMNISNSSGNTQGQQIAVDAQGNVNVVWLDNSAGTYAVFFSRSSDGGLTFSAPVNVSNHAGSSVYSPELAMGPSGNIFVAWNDNSLGYFADFSSRSTDGGATFSAPQLISNPGAGTPQSESPKIFVDPTGNIDVVWIDTAPGYYAVFFSRSTDGGATFSSPTNVSNNNSDAFQASFAVDANGDIYAAWVGFSVPGHQLTVLFSTSTDGGDTFSPAKILVGSVPIFFPDTPQVAADSKGNVNVVWETDESADISFPAFSYAHSSDGGATFGPVVNVRGCPPSGFAYFPRHPNMVLDSLGGTNIAYQTICGSGTVNLARYVGNTLTISTSWNASSSGLPTQGLAVDSSNNIDLVFVGGASTSPGPDLWFTESTDSGASFSAAQSISSNTATSNPEITTSGGNSYVVWQQTDSSGNANIFFSSGIPVLLSALAVSPTSVTGGSSSTGTVTLSGPAPTGGAVISLSSNDATITASFNSVTLTANLAVQPFVALPPQACAAIGAHNPHQ